MVGSAPCSAIIAADSQLAGGASTGPRPSSSARSAATAHSMADKSLGLRMGKAEAD
jgi:hypothetical protein